MSDLVERLRAWQGHKVPIEYLREAADEIERLRESLIEMSANYILQCRSAGDMPDSGVIERQRAALAGRAALEVKP